MKIARLQHEHGKWISASSLVLTVVIAFVFGVNEFARFAYMLMLMYMAIIIVSALGLAFGVFRNFAKKISVVNDALMDLKESDRSA